MFCVDCRSFIHGGGKIGLGVFGSKKKNYIVVYVWCGLWSFVFCEDSSFEVYDMGLRVKKHKNQMNGKDKIIVEGLNNHLHIVASSISLHTTSHGLHKIKISTIANTKSLCEVGDEKCYSINNDASVLYYNTYSQVARIYIELDRTSSHHLFLFFSFRLCVDPSTWTWDKKVGAFLLCHWGFLEDIREWSFTSHVLFNFKLLTRS